MAKKKAIITISIIAGVLLTVVTFACVGLPGIQMVVDAVSSKLPAPSVTYGEFPFKLVYEIDGEKITIEDTLICEYKSSEWNWNVGHYRIWDTRLKSGNEEPLVNGNGFFLTRSVVEGVGSVGIYFDFGNSEYYMGLEQTSSYYESFGITPGDIVAKCSVYNGPISEEDLYNEFNIKIIEKFISEPLVNETK